MDNVMVKFAGVAGVVPSAWVDVDGLRTANMSLLCWCDGDTEFIPAYDWVTGVSGHVEKLRWAGGAVFRFDCAHVDVWGRLHVTACRVSDGCAYTFLCLDAGTWPIRIVKQGE